MAGQKNYFGKGNISPVFPGSKKIKNPADPTVPARQSLKNAENTAGSKNSSSLIDLENNPSSSFYIGKGVAKPLQEAKQKSIFARFMKAMPALFMIVIIAISAFLIFGASSFLGPHLETLFTEATSTDYTAYTYRSNEITKEILSGDLEMPDYLRKRLEDEEIHVNGNSLEYDGITITAGNFDTVYNGNVHFREAVTNARRGRGATFFDAAAQEFYKKLGLSRDVFHDYNVTGNQETDDGTYDSLLSKYFGGGSNMSINTAVEEETEDEEGNTILEYVATGEDISSASGVSSSSEEKAKEFLNAVGDRVAAETPGCAALEVGNMIATAVASNERYTSAHDYMTKMESLSKSRQGTGEKSAVHSVLNWFTTTATSTVYDAVTGNKTQVTGSPLEAEGMRVVLGGLTAEKANAKKFSLERSYESTNQSILNAGLSTVACKVERASHTFISLSALAIPGSFLVKATIGILLDVALDIGVKIAASTVLSLLVPTVAQVMFENPFKNAVGISGGEYFAEGASNINTLAAQQNSGGTGASKEQVLAYNKATDVVLAQQAEIDQKNYSPFDATNHNTFFGRITYSLLPLATSSSTISAPLSTFSSIMGRALNTSTYASGENTSLMTNFGNYCDKISEIGASGNIYCTMITTHDLSTLSVPDNDEQYRSVINQSIYSSGGEEKVRENSPLSRFISYWVKRYSIPGVYDANIADACRRETTFLPFLTDIIDMVLPFESDYCESVADGSRFINSSSNPAWEKMEKWHQLYVITARVKKNLGLYGDKDDPVTAYIKEYESTHPLDNSRAGYLARISGLEKTDAEGIIALSDYLQFIANYNPNERYSFMEEQPASLLLSTDEKPAAIAVILPEKWSYYRREQEVIS